jgi:biotin-(acetyl-CoA carboxylase) ligase
MSLIIKPRIELDKINILSLMAAISVCEAINETSNLETRIKWPNDIVIYNKKIAGILIDSSIKDLIDTRHFYALIYPNNYISSVKYFFCLKR